MPNYKIKIKANKRLQDVIIVGGDEEDARNQILSRHPAAEIISIEQKGPSGTVPRDEQRYANKRSNKTLKKIAIVLVILALAGGYLILRHMGKL